MSTKNSTKNSARNSVNKIKRSVIPDSHSHSSAIISDDENCPPNIVMRPNFPPDNSKNRVSKSKENSVLGRQSYSINLTHNEEPNFINRGHNDQLTQITNNTTNKLSQLEETWQKRVDILEEQNCKLTQDLKKKDNDCRQYKT